MATTKDCDILIVGGGIGGVAAALQAAAMASECGLRSIILTEETDWLGGQYTSQGVTAADDNPLVVRGRYPVAASELYFRFHETIRGYYRPEAAETLRKTVTPGGGPFPPRSDYADWINGPTFSPGNPWGSRMSFLPADGVRAIADMLRPFVESGLLEILYRLEPVEVRKERDRVVAVRFRGPATGPDTIVRAGITIDATELGDLLPLAGARYRVGIEASHETGEPSLFDPEGRPLYPEPLPECTQAFTFTFAVEWRPPGEDHRRPWDSRPADYESNRPRYSLVDSGRWFLMTRWNEYARAEAWQRTGGKGPLPYIPPFWTYRRMLDAMVIDPSVSPILYPRFADGTWHTEFDPETDPWFFRPTDRQTHPGDIIEVNWISNDYAGESIIDRPAGERDAILRRARDLSLGFLYWLWYEAPRDPEDARLDPSLESNWSLDPATGKKRGYANLRFRPDVMGTGDGLSKYPYIRESRRLRALRTVLQQDLMGPASERARPFHDSVGIGQYGMDIHPCDLGSDRKRDVRFKWVRFEDGSEGSEAACRRYQIPWGAMIPETIDGLLAAAKNLGTTHISASACRLHPVEFQAGQAAGAAAALCVAWDAQPRDLWVAEPATPPGDAERRLRRLQWELLRHRVPLYWNEDCGWDTEYFVPVQFACLLGILEPRGRVFEPETPLSRAEAALAAFRLARPDLAPLREPPFVDIPLENKELAMAAGFLAGRGALGLSTGGGFQPDKPVAPDRFRAMIAAAPAAKAPCRATGAATASGTPHVPAEAAAETDALTRGEAAGMLCDILRERFGLPQP